MAAKDGHVVNIFSWLTDPANWTGSGGIPAQVGYHLLYSAIALLAALVIAVPLGILIGYTGRGEALVAGSANALRALPSLGLLVLLFLIISPVVTGKLVYVLPTIIVLVLLAVPPILTGTYAGSNSVGIGGLYAVNGVVGLRDVYGLNFKEFVSLDAGGTLTMTALVNGQIQAGDLFSTDPGLETNNLVALEDDKSLFAAENVVPLIKSAKQNDTITKTLDAVSAKLTTDDLISMNAEAAKGTNLSDIAKKWLANAGISKS
jgi:Substrate binding domain of ABC-type glycine betaine transport system